MVRFLNTISLVVSPTTDWAWAVKKFMVVISSALFSKLECLSHPNVIFSGETGAYPHGLHTKDRLLNVRRGCK